MPVENAILWQVGNGAFLAKEEVVLLLSLQAENSSCPNKHYAIRLYEADVMQQVSPQFISDWFKKGFAHKGSFWKPNLIPLDKFRPKNIVRYLEYRAKIEQLFDHSKFHFVTRSISSTNMCARREHE